ncbi:structural maintenance of chromosomes protein 3-like [Chelonus insularis]|uniref:structural maintenance of chromosomes protein 3-like n=1 Tax=Chelonus insularis TaxID=460826 RepID=UPI00158C8DED|nr:structural maintenance of chromosomes protein 3-like [Chelonus insularis]
MFINEIQVEGFKTFGHPTSLKSFFPGINVFVGLNGSGKTSILDAIEFVLDENSATLKPKQFDELNCHDTRRKNDNSIKVEIFFDNSDNKYDKYPSQFSIKRYVTPLKDCYYVNGTKLSKEKFIKAIQSLDINLRMLKQGEVNEFASSTDRNRLKLLFQMIDYEELEELGSVKLNKLIEVRNDTMVEVIKCYEKLEKEHNLCQEFQKILKQKEFIIYRMEKMKMMETTNKIHHVEQKSVDESMYRGRKILKYINLNSELDLLQCQLDTSNNHLQSLKDTEKGVANRIKELETQKSELEISIVLGQKNKEDREKALEEKKKALEMVEKDVASEKESMKSLKAELSSVKAYIEELELKYEVELLELNRFAARLSTGDTPEREEGRESSLKRSISSVREEIGEKEEYLKNYQQQYKEKNDRIIELRNKISSVCAKIDLLKASRQKYSEELETLQKKIKISMNLVRAVAAKVEEESQKLESIKNIYHQTYKKLKSAIKFDVMYNKDALEKALESFNNDNPTEQIDVSTYHGLVIDCFEYNPESESVILAIAAQYLFHFVFEHGKDANAVLKKLEDGCNVGAMCLDLLKVSDKSLPKNSDAIPLMTQIKYEPTFEKLVKFMFGRILICRDVKIALKLCKKFDITCVTTSGNVFFPNGISEAGTWNENERNQMSIYRLVANQHQRIKDKEAEIKKLNNQELDFKDAISQALEQKNLLELQIEENEKQRTLLEGELDMVQIELCSISVDDHKHDRIVTSVGTLAKKIKELQLNSINYDEEMTDEEYQRYQELKTSTEHLLALCREEEKKAAELDRKIAHKLTVFQETYLKIKSDLQKDIQTLILANEMESNQIKCDAADLESKMKMLTKENLKLQKLQPKIKQLEKDIAEKVVSKENMSKRAETLKLKIDISNMEIDHLTAETEELQKIIEEAKQKIRDIPIEVDKDLDPELKEIEKSTMKQLVALQQKVNDQMRRLSYSMNDIASEMFLRMQEEVTKVKGKIKQFEDNQSQVNRLKEKYKFVMQRKIYSQLLEINEGFRYYVNKFMPQASAELMLMTDDQDYTVEEAQNAVVLKDLDGVSIRFAEFENGPIQELDKLSGGQKTVLSLALFLAVKSCHKISILLCDEIDQALDCINRQTLLEIFQEMTDGGQIFLITFRPELVDAGDHLYKVEKSHKTSVIEDINRQQALDFLVKAKRG